MQVFLFYLIIAFVGGAFLWDRKPSRRLILLVVMCVFLVIAYRFFEQI